MGTPEAAQVQKGDIGEGHIPILASFALADMHTLVGCVDIANFQPQAFSQPQAHAVQGKEVNAIAQTIDTVDQELHFLARRNIR